MSEDIKERLQTTSAECLKCYEAWDGNDKDIKARGALQDAIHELRKVASRLEITLAISERDQLTQKPLPIPPHRDALKRGGSHVRDDFEDDGQQQHQTQVERKPQRRRPQGGGAGPKKSAQGGNGNEA